MAHLSWKIYVLKDLLSCPVLIKRETTFHILQREGSLGKSDILL